MATATKIYISPEEYLEQERKAEFRSEYFCGQVTAMAGGTYQHSVIISNMVAELRQGLRQTACTVSTSDVRLAIAAAGFYTYPDVMVVGGEPAFVDGRSDTVSNPVLLVEVLSDSTRGYDRTEKFQSYRTLPSLREYLTIAQGKVHLERYTRQSDDSWVLTDHTEPSSGIQLASVGLKLRVADVYEKIKFA